jgi:hypothetical protein
MAAVEYSGHWAKIARNLAGLSSPLSSMEESEHMETLSASYPWQPVAPDAVPEAAVVAYLSELDGGAGVRLFHGDTCLRHAGHNQIL